MFLLCFLELVGQAAHHFWASLLPVRVAWQAAEAPPRPSISTSHPRKDWAGGTWEFRGRILRLPFTYSWSSYVENSVSRKKTPLSHLWIISRSSRAERNCLQGGMTLRIPSRRGLLPTSTSSLRLESLSPTSTWLPVCTGSSSHRWKHLFFH